MDQLNAHQFEKVYKSLGIELDSLGCVMLNIKKTDMPLMPEYENELADKFYFSEDEDRHWIDGYVARSTPHLTLLYGLLKPAEEYKYQIDDVLKGWELKTVEVESIGSFDSMYEDEKYCCIVAHIKMTPELEQGNQRIELLPHINTYTGYKPHVTLAYIKEDPEFKEQIIKEMSKELVGKTLTITGINYGGDE